ncbi:hypothetical protein ACIGCZ_25085 [Streptomyces nigra]|uniref:hypothetical protein n=1 Tax=Streptomyces nigra TaxID=1827580 RepID=UPI0037D06D46
MLDLTERTLTEEIAVSPDGRRAYAAGMALHHRTADSSAPPPTLLVVDTATHEVVAREPLAAPGCPVHVAADGRVLVGLAPADAAGVPQDGRLTVLVDGSVITVLDVDPGDPDTTQGARGIAYLP